MTDVLYARNRAGIVKKLIQLRLSKRPAIGLDVAPFELQFFRSAILALMRRRSDANLLLFYRYAGDVIQPIELRGLERRLTHIEHHPDTFDLFSDLDLYITTEQFVSGPPSVYTVTLFHGQPAKGFTFRYDDHQPLRENDALFMYGPFQRRALQDYLRIWNEQIPDHLSLFDIGYTKSDDLLQRKFDRAAYLTKLGLDSSRKTIIYAPAFNEGASMREFGEEIIAVICGLDGFNVLAKLAIDCWLPNMVAGVDWLGALTKLERRFPHFRLVRDLEIDQSLAASDVLITCVSSVGLEFLALRRPVIFIHTPKFFSEAISRHLPGADVSGWSELSSVNGGREYGLVVSSPGELPEAIEQVLDEASQYPRMKDRLPQDLLYNPGSASRAAAEKIDELIRLGVRSKRGYAKRPLARAVLR